MSARDEDPAIAARRANWRNATKMVHAGRATSEWSGLVNPPIERGSTILHVATADLFSGRAGPTYGRSGHKAQRALESALAEIEGGAGTQVTSSGLSAVTLAILSVVEAGDDILVTDSVYGPTRRFCERFLPRLGVHARFYDPLIGAGIAAFFQPDTRLVVMESPGSLTFEMQDCPAIAAAARAHGAISLLDNTWSAGIYFRPFDHGIDLSVQAATKYQVGHADALMGAVISGSAVLDSRVKEAARLLGISVGPEDVYLCLRGLRTMGVRLKAHEAGARIVAEFLAGRPEVLRVLYPAWPGDPGHEIWKRDFTGATGLLGFEMELTPAPALDAFYRAMRLFGHGFSWGGYESLAIPADGEMARSCGSWRGMGPLVRLHVGLEDPDDLVADLEAAFTTRAAEVGGQGTGS